MPVWRAQLASCLGALTLLATDPGRADTAVAALDLPRQPAAEPDESGLDCLALNIYWEARSEPLLGQVAVAAVTLNRVAASAFPDTVCEVVFQGEERGLHLCQFSWRCDGRADEPRNAVAWAEARRVARLALHDQITDPTGGALWYHAAYVLPSWTREMALRTRIGGHLFYGRADRPEQADSEDAAPATALAAGERADVAAPRELRIDLAPEPAGGLALCVDETLCTRSALQLYLPGEADAAASAHDERPTLGPPAGPITEIAPPIPPPARSRSPIS